MKILKRIQAVIGPVRITDLQIAKGVKVPWWMGIANVDWCLHVVVMYAVPLHHLVALVWKMNQIWCRYRIRESWMEREVNKAVIHDREEAFARNQRLNAMR